MPPARPSDPNRRATPAERLADLAPSRRGVAYAFVGSGPFAVGTGIGIELGLGWGIAAGGLGVLAVGWLLGAE